MNIKLVKVIFCFILSIVKHVDCSLSNYFRLTDNRARHYHFKLGIELQEVSGLCPWAKKNQQIQKQPIFKVKLNDLYTWHLEIDGNDIEFVSEPFIYEQKNQFEQCISGIKLSVECLKLLNKIEFSFEDWLNIIKDKFKQINNIKIFEENPLFMKNTISIPSEEWCPIFAPQITIQHPLEWTIPLYIAMTMSSPIEYNGKFINKCNSAEEILLYHTLPFKKMILDLIISKDDTSINKIINLYHNKLIGLMFIVAITMESIGNLSEDDDKSLKDIFNSSQLFGQFDAKMQLILMSRRPLSQMYEDIGGDLALTSLIALTDKFINYNKPLEQNSFSTVFETIMMSKENDFKENILLLHKANYGEQYFDNSKNQLDLSFFKQEINKDFIIGQDEAINIAFSEHLIDTTINEIYIQGLLKNGIITTTMLRNLNCIPIPIKKYFMENYYKSILDSISNTSDNKRTILKLDNKKLEFEETFHPYDLLSPPIFLDHKTDAMGYYKQIKDVDDYGKPLWKLE